MSKLHAEESLGANPGDAALNPADQVAMGVPASKVKDASPARTGNLRALQHRAFRLLFVAFVINQTGFWISHISLQDFMVELTKNDTRQSGLLFFALFSPAFFLAPLAGVAADRFDRKHIVLACYGVICLASGTLAYGAATGLMTPHLLLVAAATMGCSFAFSGPASFAIAANSVPEADLASAVSLQSAANNLTRVGGPLFAAPLVVNHHFEISFGIYLVAALVAAGLTLAMKIERYAADEEESGIWSRMWGGFQHARERHPALPALSTVAVLSFCGVSHVVLLPAFAQDVLGDPRAFAWMVAATGIGAVAGALRTGRDEHTPSLRHASLSLVAYGAFLVGFAASKNLIAALITQAVIGYFYFTIMTSLQTLIQKIVDESKRGRVMSLFQVAWAGLVPFGSLTMGFVARPFGTPATLFISALACIAYGIGMTIYAMRSRARLETA